MSDADADALLQRLEFSLDGDPLQAAGSAGSRHQAGGAYRFERVFGRPLANGAHRLTVHGLDALRAAPVAVTIVTRSGLGSTFVVPWDAVDRTVSSLPGGERLVVRYGSFSRATLVVGFESDQPATGFVAWIIRRQKEAAPIFTAVFILLISTCVQRAFISRTAQLGELSALRFRLSQIKDADDNDGRLAFIGYLRALQTRSEYAGFGERFRKPLEEILERGNIRDVQFYADKLKLAKPHIKLSWIFFLNSVT